MAKGDERAAVAGPMEGPWELPRGWRWETLGEHLAGRGASFDPARAGSELVELYSVPSFETGAPEITSASEIGSSKQLVATGDVLLCKINPRINRAWVVGNHSDFRKIASTEWIRFAPRSGVLPAFLKAYLSTERVRSFLALNVSGVGGSLMRVKPSTLAGFPLPVPPPDVQRRIVTRMGELFAEIDDGERAIGSAGDQLETYRTVLLRAAVTGELTDEWRTTAQKHASSATLSLVLEDHRRRHAGRRGDYTPPRLPTNSDAPTLPQGWCWASVEAAGDVLLGRQRAPQHHSGDHPRPYLRVANVMEGRLDLSDVKVMNFTPAEYVTFALQPGDVLLNEGQAPDLIGRPAIYSGEIDGCCFQKTLLRFRAGSRVDPEFSLIVFRHYMRNGRFRREARITTNIGHLTQVRFLPMEFPVPPLDEQREIVARVRRAEEAVIDLLTPVRAGGELRQSILASAFRGDLVA